MSINIIDPGFTTLVQDLGREGYYHLGIPESGVMDKYAMSVANILVGNDINAAGLEITFIGAEIEFQIDTKIAVTGGHIAPKINDEIKPIWTTLEISKDDILSFDSVKSGSRCYLAISGGIDVPKVLGSRSTFVSGSLGGQHGRCLQANDTLPISSTIQREVSVGVTVTKKLRRQVEDNVEIKVIPGLYCDRLTEESKERFYTQEWTVGTDVGRVAYRFHGGSPLEFVERQQPFGACPDPSYVVDGCYPYGSIQIPYGQDPIVLHRDAVSGGGFCMIGAVITTDMNYIGQLQPNKKVKFVPVTLDQALKERYKMQIMFNQIQQIINI